MLTMHIFDFSGNNDCQLPVSSLRLLKERNSLHTLMLWNSTQLPALLLAVSACSSSILTNTSRSENLRPPAGIVVLCWQPGPAEHDLYSSFCLLLFPLSIKVQCPSCFSSSSSSSSCPSFRSQVEKPFHLHLKLCMKNQPADLFIYLFYSIRFLRINLNVGSLALYSCLSGWQGSCSCPVSHTHPSQSPFNPCPDKSVWSHWPVRWKGANRRRG